MHINGFSCSFKSDNGVFRECECKGSVNVSINSNNNNNSNIPIDIADNNGTYTF